jgi:hypothetical protein
MKQSKLNQSKWEERSDKGEADTLICSFFSLAAQGFAAVALFVQRLDTCPVSRPIAVKYRVPI